MTDGPESSAPVGRILILDAEPARVEDLAHVLRTRGHHVVLATAQDVGLQRAIDIAADVLVIDRSLPGLDLRAFFEVLRSNPRTSGAQVFLAGEAELVRALQVDAVTEPLLRPFNAAEVCARVEAVMRRRKPSTKQRELHGDLGQVALFDLLQVFAQNRRSGTLTVQSSMGIGEIIVRQGRIIDARIGRARGEKALYRLLGVVHGQFVFRPESAYEPARIHASTDQLLMEAARQADEIVRLKEELPAFNVLLSSAAVPEILSTTQRQIVEHVEEPHTLEELLDLIAESDLRVLESARELCRMGALVAGEVKSARLRLAEDDEAMALRAAVLRLRRAGLHGPVRLGVVARSAQDVRSLIRALSSVEEYVGALREPCEMSGSLLGSIGMVQAGGAAVELFSVPLDPGMGPAWAALLSSSTRILALIEGPLDDPFRKLLSSMEIEPVRPMRGWSTPEEAVQALRAVLGTTAGSSVKGPFSSSAHFVS